MINLTRDQILMLHRELIAAHGGNPGIRDEGLLDSAIAAPFQVFNEQELFSTIQQKAVRLGYGLIMNHPFVDGNKRIGTHVMLTTLEKMESFSIIHKRNSMRGTSENLFARASE